MHQHLVLEISAICSFLSPALVFTLIPIGIRLGRPGPIPIAFGDAEELGKLQATMPGVLWLEALALAAPILSLGIGFGWYALLGAATPYAAMGVVLWYLGMIFVIINDTLELGLVATLPREYARAADAVKPALLGFGTVVGNCIELFSLVGGVVSFGGIALVAASMLHAPGVPLWLGTLGMVASVIILVSRTGTFIGGSGGPLGKLGLLGFVAFMVWVVTTGFFMLSFPA
jgi:hypothetical protein